MAFMAAMDRRIVAVGNKHKQRNREHGEFLKAINRGRPGFSRA